MDFHCKYYWSNVDGVPTHHLKCEDEVLEIHKKKLFIIIPGNPGSSYFYDTFAKSLNSKSKAAVWGISHTGHVATKSRQPVEIPCDEKHPKLDDCGLQRQIDIKVKFIKEHVLPYYDEVYLIGHSIGCYISIHIINALGIDKIKKILLMLPTIENLHTTDNGVNAMKLCKLRWSAWYVGKMFEFIPRSLREYLIHRYVETNDEKIKITVIEDLLTSEVADSASFMGKEEMEMVRERDDHLIEKYSSNILLYYGATDAWCPQSYFFDTKKRHPSVQMKLCDKGIHHAFVMYHSHEVADMVARWHQSDFECPEL